MRPGGASVETELVLSTNCTPMRPQGENMDALRLVEVCNGGLGWDDFANEGSILRQGHRDCLDLKFGGHLPLSPSFFLQQSCSGESCYLSGKQFLEPK